MASLWIGQKGALNQVFSVAEYPQQRNVRRNVIHDLIIQGWSPVVTDRRDKKQTEQDIHSANQDPHRKADPSKDAEKVGHVGADRPVGPTGSESNPNTTST